MSESNAPNQPIRWSARRAAVEFSVGHHHLLRKLRESGEAAGEDGLFGTGQVVTALFGSLHQARVAKLKADGERSRMLAEEQRGELLPRKELAAGLSQIADAMCSVIRHSNLSREDQERLQTELSEIPVVLTKAGRKGRRSHSDNGE
jgi:hypothetical protein